MLIDFLQANNLATRELIPSGQQVPLDFELWASDLTEEGNEFYKTAVQKWYRALDRGTDPKNSKILERELKKMREGDAAKG